MPFGSLVKPFGGLVRPPGAWVRPPRGWVRPGGGTYVRTDGISPLCSTGHRPLSGPLPKKDAFCLLFDFFERYFLLYHLCNWTKGKGFLELRASLGFLDFLSKK